MGLENVPRCQHVKVNGTQCGSPALRRRRLCFFHDRIRSEQARIAADTAAQRRFELPLLEDANAVQVALMKVIQMLGSGRMDHKTAGLILYALQTASINLRAADFEVEDIGEIVIDRDTVSATCINGPQWFEEDFDDDAEDEDQAQNENENESENEQQRKAEPEDEPSVGKLKANAASGAKSRAKNEAKAATDVSAGKARKQVQSLARDWLLAIAQKPQ